MSDILVLILASVILLFLVGLFFFSLRRRLTLKPEEDKLLIRYPFKTREIALDKELESWKVDKNYYIRWGLFYSISMKLNNGKYLSVDSLFNQNKFDAVYSYLTSRFQEKRSNSA